LLRGYAGSAAASAALRAGWYYGVLLTSEQRSLEAHPALAPTDCADGADGLEDVGGAAILANWRNSALEVLPVGGVAVDRAALMARCGISSVLRRHGSGAGHWRTWALQASRGGIAEADGVIPIVLSRARRICGDS
jgi:hypothetical protein